MIKFVKILFNYLFKLLPVYQPQIRLPKFHLSVQEVDEHLLLDSVKNKLQIFLAMRQYGPDHFSNRSQTMR